MEFIRGKPSLLKNISIRLHIHTYTHIHKILYSIPKYVIPSYSYSSIMFLVNVVRKGETHEYEETFRDYA